MSLFSAIGRTEPKLDGNFWFSYGIVGVAPALVLLQKALGGIGWFYAAVFWALFWLCTGLWTHTEKIGEKT